MLSPLRNRLGIPGVISVIALVFAMLGGAYAATNNSGGGKATASAKKGPRGPRGPKGATGPAGPAGPQGPAGANGKDGANGADGEDGAKGTNGTNGKSVTNTEFSGVKGPCEEGGTELVVGSAVTYACNGEKGDEGDKGEPWTAAGTLPPDATETGAWAFGRIPKETEAGGVIPIPGLDPQFVPISFTIPLAAGLSESNVHFLKVGETEPTSCPGTSADPQAASGHLCVYSTLEGGSFVFAGIQEAGGGGNGASKSGALLRFSKYVERDFAYGTWAVTAPPASAP